MCFDVVWKPLRIPLREEKEEEEEVEKEEEEAAKVKKEEEGGRASLDGTQQLHVWTVCSKR